MGHQEDNMTVGQGRESLSLHLAVFARNHRAKEHTMAKAATIEETVVTVTLDFVRETPGTFLYKTEDEGAAVTSVYVKKAGFPEGAPASVVVTVVAS